MFHVSELLVCNEALIKSLGMFSIFSGCLSDIPFNIGNGICEDDNNNEPCHYDGGDCCLTIADTDHSYYTDYWCIECLCHETIDCLVSLDLIGDGICNDESNNADCIFDGGDCCRACTNTDNCTECICHGEYATANDLSCKYRILISRSYQ